MKRVHLALVSTMTVLAVTATSATAAVAPRHDEREALQDRLDDLVASVAIGAVVEIRDGRGVWRDTSGVAVLGTSRAVNERSLFRAGSISKTFVATVALQLVAEGRLRLDDPVERWLPGVVPAGDEITVRQLLNHTSGVYDYKRTLTIPPDPRFLAERWRTWSAAELVQRAVAHPPTFEPPGSAYSYTNTGYLLIGQVIEAVTGRSYGEEVERRIIRPLRLAHTSMPGTSPRIRGPHPHGYAPIEEDGVLRLRDVTSMNPSIFGASGELVSTTSDLNTFFAALLGGRLLPDRLLVEMEESGIEDGTYGLGLSWWDTTCGVRVYGNDGDALAYQSWSFTTEDRSRQVTLALTPNHDGDPDAAVDAYLDEAFCG